MCDFDDDFGDYDDGGDCMDEDSFEDEWEAEPLEEPDFNEPEEPESDEDGFTAKDAFFIGPIFGNAYEEGLDEQKRKELLKKKQAS